MLAAKQLMKGKEEFKFSDTSDPLYNRKQRMNYYAVTALLARVYLWGNDKEAALKEAKEIIGEAAEKVLLLMNWPIVLLLLPIRCSIKS